MPAGRQRRRVSILAPAMTLALAGAAIGLSGCSSARTQPLSVYASYRALKFIPFGLSSYGIGFVRPENWSDLSDQVRAPVVAIIASGPSVIAVSSYPRSAPPPPDDAGLERLRRRLVHAIKARQATFTLISSKAYSVDGHPAIAVDGIESIDGQRRQVRSIHIFLDANEVVVEEYAPVTMFARVDRQVFTRVADSLRVFPGGPTGATGATGSIGAGTTGTTGTGATAGIGAGATAGIGAATGTGTTTTTSP